MTTRDYFILKVAFVLICIAILVIWTVPWRKHLDAETLKAMVENARLRSEITTLEAANGAYEDYFDCGEIKRQLGIGG